MDLLKVFAIMTSLAATVVAKGGLMCNPLNDFPTIATRCLESVGLSNEKAMRFMPDKDGLIGINKEDLMESCREHDLFLQAHECIKDYAERCPQVSMDYVAYLEDAAILISQQCGNPFMNLDCIAALFRNGQQVGACVDRMREGWNYAQNMTKEQQECQTGFDFITCSVQFLEVCDSLTANYFDVFSFLLITPPCADWLWQTLPENNNVTMPSQMGATV